MAAFFVSLFLIGGVVSCGSQENVANPDTPQSRAALARYDAYLKESSAQLIHWVETIGAKVREASAPKAGSRYAAARVPYGHIAPAAELLERLDARIDGGFDRIEKAVFLDETTRGMGPVARQLLVDVRNLRSRIAAGSMPIAIVEGARGSLARLTTQALKGTEEPHALNDLVDVAAGLEGLEAAVDAIRPLLKEVDPELAAQLETQFRKAYAAVGEWGVFAKEPDQPWPQEPGISFVIYSEFSPQEIREFSDPVERLVPLLAQAQAALENE